MKRTRQSARVLAGSIVGAALAVWIAGGAPLPNALEHDLDEGLEAAWNWAKEIESVPEVQRSALEREGFEPATIRAVLTDTADGASRRPWHRRRRERLLQRLVHALAAFDRAAVPSSARTYRR